MTVRTPHVAFRDLLSNGIKSVSFGYQYGDWCPLRGWITVVEFQDPGVGFLTVNARVPLQVAQDEFPGSA